MNPLLTSGLLVVLALGFQDPPAPPPAPAAPVDETKEQLKKGLEASAAAGGFTFTGSVDQDSPFGGAAMAMGAPMLAVGPDGKCSGTLGADGMTHIRLEKDKNVYEMFRKGNKTVHRQVWKGTQIPSGSFAAEAGAALNLARLAKIAGKSKDVKKEEGTKKVGEVECVTYKVALSPDLVDAEEEAEPALGGMNFKMFELKKIEGRFYLGKDDNLLKKAEIKFVRGFNAMIAAAMPGGGGGDEDDDEEDGGGMVKTTFASTFKFTLGAFSKTAAVTVPDDVKSLLGD